MVRSVRYLICLGTQDDVRDAKKKKWSSIEAGKDKEWVLPWTPQGCLPCKYNGFTLWNASWAFNLQNCMRINVHCCNLSSLRFFITVDGELIYLPPEVSFLPLTLPLGYVPPLLCIHSI
jgi:hypothetical protein